jgi:hypothetical protein
MLAGYAVALAPRAALILTACYLIVHVPAARLGSSWWRARSEAVRRLVLGVEAAHKLHPGRIILLSGVTDALFWDALRHKPFDALGGFDVFLVPGAESGIVRRPESPSIPEAFVLSPAEVLSGMETSRFAVYDAAADPIRNITRTYEASAARLFAREPPRRIDVSRPLLEHLLGPGWHPIDAGGRWMGRRASLRIAGPAAEGSGLRLAGYCPPAILTGGPVTLSVAVEGVEIRRFQIARSLPRFEFELPLPRGLAGKPLIEIGLEAGRTLRSPDGTLEYGLVFGTFEVR